MRVTKKEGILLSALHSNQKEPRRVLCYRALISSIVRPVTFAIVLIGIPAFKNPLAREYFSSLRPLESPREYGTNAVSF